MHSQILMDKTPSYPNANPAPFRIFDMEQESHWDYLLSKETLWFEEMIDMQNMLLALHHRCFCNTDIEVDLLIMKVTTIGSVSRVLILKDRLWYLVELRNCTAVMMETYENRQEAEKHC
ncbi:MAG: hypothetical protein V7749_01090 [Cocleimonas sp.]